MDKEYTGTATVNQTTNKPTFTTFTIGQISKTWAVQDKYSNVLASNDLLTLVGSDTQKVIYGYSKVRAIITAANKMVALNSATAVKYRLVGVNITEADYSADSTVNIELNNVLTKNFSVKAIDSRNLETEVVNNLSTLITHTPVSLYNVVLTRTALPSTDVALQFSGSFWKQYFGGGVSGTLNTVTMHYRYKESTVAWGAQTWIAITPTDSSGNLSYGAGNGTVLKDGNNETGSDVVFDNEKSYDVEIRIFDKLTQMIVSGVIDKGIPVVDITKYGMGVMKAYDNTDSAELQVANEISRNGVALQTDIDLAQSNAEATALGYVQKEAFGNGIDGDVTISVDTTLTRDMHYNNLTIDNGVTLYPAGFVIYVAGTLTNNGTISAKGATGTAGSTAGSARPDNAGCYLISNPFLSAPAGGVGTNAGGASGTGNAAGGAGGSPSVSSGNLYAPFLLKAGCGGGSGGSHGQLVAGKTGLSTPFGASGGTGKTGSGTLSNWATGGNGGGGGGVILIFAKTINNTGTINAEGGIGGAGGTASTSRGGGGGGGGGGIIAIYYRSTTGSGIGTLSVAGGAVGDGGTGGSAGANGTTYTQQI